MKLIHLVGLLILSCISLLLCTVVTVRADSQREAEALVNWKDSLASADECLGSWTLANSTSLCSWPCITCDLAGHVATLRILNAGLNGTLTRFDFSAFPHLELLSLYNNSGLYGTIPAGIGNLTRLVTLRITDSPYLRGTIPRSIGQLKHLTLLDLEDLGLDGTLPEEIGNLTSLDGIRLKSVTLTGSLPQTIGMLTELSWLHLSNNNMTGSIPLEIGNMTELQIMDFSGNYLDGQLPGTISHLIKLQYLYLSGNQLEGQITPELGDRSHLDEVCIGYNNFSGLFPSSICVGGALNLVSAQYNEFSSIHPQTFKNCTTLMSVDFTANNIAAELRVCFGKHSRWLEYMSFRKNLLYGSLLTEQGEIFLCNSSLQELDLANNALHGSLSKCLWDMPSLQFIDLSSNTFTGIVPFSTTCKDSLSYLNLANNHFRGTFPLGLQKCKSLISLDLGGNHLSGTIPSWVSVSFRRLEVLGLSSNIFGGLIPHQIFQFSRLRLLDLSKNRLTGPIPGDFTNFTGMTQENTHVFTHPYSGSNGEVIEIVWKNAGCSYNMQNGAVVGMDLSSNFLSQEIPNGITTLLGLRYLNLSGNQLSGFIPEDFGSLVFLESLDLSQNQLSGEIPPSFVALKSMSVMNLSYNGLSGRIPTGSQMQTLVDPAIYSHNPGLCGFPLEDCINSSTSKQNEVSQVVDREALWLYCFVAAGFIFGFWLYWGMFLLYSETWRCALHQYMDNLQGKVTKRVYSCMSCFQRRGP